MFHDNIYTLVFELTILILRTYYLKTTITVDTKHASRARRTKIKGKLRPLVDVSNEVY